MIIYKITNKINGKLYVGQTVQKLSDRWSDHCRPCLGQHVNRSAIADAIRKHGKDNFTIEQIDTAGTLEALNILEIHYINKYGSLSPNGYNLELGGDNKRCNEETKIKISETMKQKDKSTLFGGKRQNGAAKGQPVSMERRKRISDTLKGRPNKALYKPVMELSTGIVYESVNAAAKALNINRVTVSGLLKSGKTGRGGIAFKLAP